MILEGGTNLSLGQRQIIAICRAIIANPDIIILDEPTSYLDNERGTLIMHKLVQHFADKTVIMTSHRALLFEKFDRIIQLSKGKIIQDGKPSDVLKVLLKQSTAFMNKFNNLS